MERIRRQAGPLALVALVAAALVVVDLVSTGRIVDATRTELAAADLLAFSDGLVDALQAYQVGTGSRDAVVDRLVSLEKRPGLSPALQGVVAEVRAVMARCPAGPRRPEACERALPGAEAAADRFESLVADEVRLGRATLQAHADRVWVVTRLSVATTLATLLAIVAIVGSGFARRRRHGSELESAQRVVRFLTGHGADLVARQDTEGRITWVSPSVERLLGFRPEQVVGLRSADVVHPDDRPLLRALFDPREGRRATPAVRFRVIRKDGATTWLEGSTTPLFDDGGNLSELLLSARDVTRQVEAEANARIGQERLRAALEAGLDAFFILDARRGPDERIVDFTFVDVNAVGAAALSRPREEVLGTSLLERLPIVRENGQFDAFAAVVTTGRPLLHEVRYDVTGRGVRTLQQQVVRVGDGIAISARDVTDQLLTEERLRGLQRLDSLGRLGAGVAHDFNNSLATIRNLAVLARDTPALPPEAKHDLETILSVADRSAALTRHLLAFARQQPLDMAAVDVCPVLRAAARFLRQEAGPNVRVESSLPEVPVGARVDAPLLEQVLVNLGHNARDAMPEGGELRLEVAPVRLETPLTHAYGEVPAGDWVVVRVTDSGSGMDAQLRSQVLEPFFTTKAPGRGTGLGLSIAWGIVTQGGGHLTLDSAPGQGTVVSLYLPPAPLPAAEPEPTATTAPRPLSGLRLLVVDDEELVRRTLVRLLRGRGAEVVEASEGREALAVLDSAALPFDAVLSDVTMPELDGIGLGRALAQRFPGLPIVLLSGHGDALAAADGLPECREFLAKPYEAGALVAATLRVVSRPRRSPGP